MLEKEDLFKDIKDDLLEVEKEMEKLIQAPNKLLTETSMHLLLAGGKRLRPAFVLMAGKFHNYSLQRLLPLAAALEIVHMGSLVHDDVVDSSVTRRGIPTVRAKWGNQVSLHTGDYLFSKALLLISQYNDERMSTILSKISVQMCQGELQQLATAYDINQNVRDYFYRIKRKTALLISASCQLGAYVSGAPEYSIRGLARYGHYLGMAFQIIDDILDMTADESQLGKPIGSDLRQGIMTLPVIYALEKVGRDSCLAKILQVREKTNEQVESAIDIIIEANGIDCAFEIAGKYIEKAKQELEKMPEVQAKKTFEKMANFIYARDY